MSDEGVRFVDRQVLPKDVPRNGQLVCEDLVDSEYHNNLFLLLGNS